MLWIVWRKWQSIRHGCWSPCNSRYWTGLSQNILPRVSPPRGFNSAVKHFEKEVDPKIYMPKDRAYTMGIFRYYIAWVFHRHNSDVIMMSMMASQITSLMTVYSTIYSGADQRKHQSYMPLAFVWGIHRWLVNSLHKRTATLASVSIWWWHHGKPNSLSLNNPLLSI